MKVLVIGGTRFVGLRLVRELVQEGYGVTILNRGKTQALLPDGIERLYADRRDAESVRCALTGTAWDLVFDVTGYQVRNLQPVVELFSGKIGRYVFVSTCGVYAPSEFVPVTEDFPLKKAETEPKGLATYDTDKVQCEEFLLQAFRETGFPVTIVRCALVYGPENWMDDRESSYFVRLLKERKILIPGNGSTLLHLVHVDDVARILITAAVSDRAPGHVYNVAGPHAITIDAWVRTIAKVVDKPAHMIHIEDLATFRGTKFGLDHPQVFPFPWERSMVWGTEKAKKELGFKPRHDLETGMRQTYEWWKQERGLEGTQLVPGKLGHDVDLAYEDELITQFQQKAWGNRL